ncbi:STYKc [Musa troglodytarum]|uniref:STYKc n=1 Tax=Musa troglodytarum TaxID=320322 RepID=A0A9E7LEE5_9LILI|nr:STYKc [Musa troglodytarum]
MEELAALRYTTNLPSRPSSFPTSPTTSVQISQPYHDLSLSHAHASTHMFCSVEELNTSSAREDAKWLAGYCKIGSVHSISLQLAETMPEFSHAHSIAQASLMSLGVIAILIVVLVLFALCWKSRKPKPTWKTPNSSKSPADYFSGNLRTISYFDYRTLKKATRDFHPKNQLGGGGFGPVYKGTLDDGRIIAVKQLSVGKSQQGEREFLAEVRMLTSIQHKNLVHLIGCCSEGAERLLVYECMTNGSLNSIFSGKSETSLNWKTRFQIIIGVARGLQYLHEDSNLRIVHRDIKASNILLDDKFQPKISDFGLARFFPEDEASLSTRFAGTLGYSAPEYALRGELSEKADIYSFGVLVLEIISCRRNTDLSLPNEMQYLPEYVNPCLHVFFISASAQEEMLIMYVLQAWRLYERSKMTDLVDSRLLEEGALEKDVLQVCHVALLCLQPHPSLRPPMSEIVAMLTCRTPPSSAPLRCTHLIFFKLVASNSCHIQELLPEEQKEAPEGSNLPTTSPFTAAIPDRPTCLSDQVEFLAAAGPFTAAIPNRPPCPSYQVESLAAAGKGALCRQALWEPLEVAAVVVDHVVRLHPLHLLLACGVQLLAPPPAAAGDSVGREASVRGRERRLRPVGLDQAASGSPVIRVPEAGVEPHGLVLGERDAPRFQVLEVSDRGAVDHEAAEEATEGEIGIDGVPERSWAKHGPGVLT